jgi:hypothetical protein
MVTSTWDGGQAQQCDVHDSVGPYADLAPGMGWYGMEGQLLTGSLGCTCRGRHLIPSWRCPLAQLLLRLDAGFTGKQVLIIFITSLGMQIAVNGRT